MLAAEGLSRLAHRPHRLYHLSFHKALQEASRFTLLLTVTCLLYCGSKDVMFSAKHEHPVLTRQLSMQDFNRCFVGSEIWFEKMLMIL